MSDAYFVRSQTGFEPTELTRGPWDRDSQHGGPPSALLAKHLIGAAPDHMDLARITVELLRPVPMGPLTAQSEVVRPGVRVCGTTAELRTGTTVVARAMGLHIRRDDSVPVPHYERIIHERPVDTERSFPLPIQHDEPSGFPESVEIHWEPGSAIGPGPGTLWMRSLVDTVEGEETSPAEWVIPLADCGNGISWWSLSDVTFVNPDLTVYLHRQPVGRWIRIHARSEWNPTGIGLAESELADEAGPIGRSLQSLYLAAL